jgi:hypothetical protein
MNSRLSSSSSNINTNCYSNHEYDYPIQSEIIRDHQENIIEEKPHVC